MASVLTAAQKERITELHSAGMSELEISGTIQVRKVLIEGFLNGTSDSSTNGVGVVDEAVADARNSALAAENVAREARAVTAASRANLEQNALTSQLLKIGVDNPSANAAELQEKFDELLKGMHDTEKELIRQEFSAILASQNDALDVARGQQRGPSELTVAMETLVPTLERLLAQAGGIVQVATDRIGIRVDRFGTHIESYLSPHGLPTVSRDAIVNPDKLLSDLIAMSDNEVASVGESLIGSDAARRLAPDDLRLKLCEIAEADAKKPASVSITQWPTAPLPSLGELRTLLQGLNLPAFSIGNGAEAGVAQPLTGLAADADQQIAEADVSLLKLRCPSCGEVNSFDLNALRDSKSRFEPCFSCSTLFDLSQHIGGDKGPHGPRYRPS